MTAFGFCLRDSGRFLSVGHNLVIKFFSCRLFGYLIIQLHFVPLVKHRLNLFDFLLQRNVALFLSLRLLEGIDSASADGRPCQLVKEWITFIIVVDVDKFTQIIVQQGILAVRPSLLLQRLLDDEQHAHDGLLLVRDQELLVDGQMLAAS